jgi:pimeloyl-ACP methyl ester carboxylesterase
MLRRAITTSVAVVLIGCSDSATLANVSPLPTSVRRTVPAGVIDTLELSESVALRVDNRGGGAGVDVELQALGDSGVVPRSQLVGGGVIHIQPVAFGLRTASLRDPVTTPMTLLVKSTAPAHSAIRQFAVRDNSSPGSTTLWTQGNETNYLDPVTGQVKVVDALELTPDITRRTDELIAAADLTDDCDLPPRLIDVDAGVNDAGRTPLVLIHGWQAQMYECRPFSVLGIQLELSLVSYQGWDTDGNRKPFGDLINSIRDGSIASKYHIYVLHYPSFQHVITTATWLRDHLPSLPGHPPVIVAHSMGGLVARAMLGMSGTPPIRGLITLGTPHEGAPAASIITGTEILDPIQAASLDAKCPLVSEALAAAGLGIFGLQLASFQPITAGLKDLAVESSLIQLLRSNRAAQTQTYTIGGTASSSFLTDPVFQQLACLTSVTSGLASDGLVPTTSAVPSWSAGAHIVAQTNHTDLPSSPMAITWVKDALGRLATCQVSAPPPTASNAFPLSGSIARQPNGDVDITINGIVIGGVVQANLSKANFTIVENDCALPSDQFDLTTGLGNIGVDLGFIQDLSSSMDDAIVSVKNTVISFASSLAAQGLDVRFGSIGYSGPGVLPSTPAGSTSEYLGPVRDLTDVNTFRSHVVNQWNSTGGGDDPENGLEAIEYAMANLSWRAGAVRILVDITNSSHHIVGDGCGCTDENLASITALLAGRAVVHVVAPSSASVRTQFGELDPYLLAAATGGKALDLGTGNFDLNTIGVSSAIAATTRLTFRSASVTTAPENLRILVTINGQTAELSPGLISYLQAHPTLRR